MFVGILTPKNIPPIFATIERDAVWNAFKLSKAGISKNGTLTTAGKHLRRGPFALVWQLVQTLKRSRKLAVFGQKIAPKFFSFLHCSWIDAVFVTLTSAFSLRSLRPGCARDQALSLDGLCEP